MGPEAEFDRVQREYFEAPEVEHFRWTTAGPGFAETEDELLAPICDAIEAPCLEIGCGEGNNLVRLTGHGACFGIDLFRRKLRFASQEVPAAHLAVSRAEALPFADASFRTLVIRDILHHMQDPKVVLDEAMRVLAPGGRFWLLEPNAGNPIVMLQIALIEAEAGARKFRPDYVEGLLDGLPLTEVSMGAAQPFPLRRVVLHYQFGIPAIGRSRVASRLLAAAERLLGRLVPRSRWCYVTASARRV